jgi:hypothetical protein
MKASKGGILYMTVPINTTLSYTLEKLNQMSLPDASNLTIVVESASHAAPQIAKTSLVSMQRVSCFLSTCLHSICSNAERRVYVQVLFALEFLKKTNRFYEDVRINREFLLDFPNLVDGPAHPQLLNGIARTDDDYSLLLHQFCLTDVYDAKPSGTPYEHFRLSDMKG